MLYQLLFPGLATVFTYFMNYLKSLSVHELTVYRDQIDHGLVCHRWDQPLRVRPAALNDLSQTFHDEQGPQS